MVNVAKHFKEMEDWKTIAFWFLPCVWASMVYLKPEKASSVND